MFKFLEYLPAAGVTATLAIVLVAVFFITSADSGALVIDTLASGGAEETPRWQRVYWCVLLGATATLLLVAGGLGALQAATLLAALPFCFIMLMLAVGLVRQTNADLAGVTLPGDAPAISERLKRLFVPPRRADILRQMMRNGEPALRLVHDAMQRQGQQQQEQEQEQEQAHGWTTSRIEVREDRLELTIGGDGDRSFVYRLVPRSRPLAAYTALEAPEARRSLTWTLAAQTNDEPRSRDLTGFSVDQIASDVLTQLERWRLARPVRG